MFPNTGVQCNSTPFFSWFLHVFMTSAFPRKSLFVSVIPWVNFHYRWDTVLALNSPNVPRCKQECRPNYTFFFFWLLEVSSVGLPFIRLTALTYTNHLMWVCSFFNIKTLLFLFWSSILCELTVINFPRPGRTADYSDNCLCQGELRTDLAPLSTLRCLQSS